MYFEFLLRRAHSRRRVERRYWSGESLYSRTTCSNSVIVGVMGPIGSGLPQFGFPRLFAMNLLPFRLGEYDYKTLSTIRFSTAARGFFENYPTNKDFPHYPCRAAILIRRPNILAAICLESQRNCVGWVPRKTFVSPCEIVLYPSTTAAIVMVEG